MINVYLTNSIKYFRDGTPFGDTRSFNKSGHLEDVVDELAQQARDHIQKQTQQPWWAELEPIARFTFSIKILPGIDIYKYGIFDSVISEIMLSPMRSNTYESVSTKVKELNERIKAGEFQ